MGFLVLSPVVRSIPKWLSSHVHGLQAFLNRRTCKLPYSIILGMDLPSKGRTAPKFLASGYPSQHPARGDRKQSLCHIFVKTCMLWLEPNCLLWKLVSLQILLSLKQHSFLELDLHLSQVVQTDLCLRMSLGWSRTTA